ncbi:MAG: hemerythrin domain-containing protein [Myxococcota bacterium]
MSEGMERGLRLRLQRAGRQMARQHQTLRPLAQALGAVSEPMSPAHFDRFTEALRAHFILEEDTVFPAVHGLHPETEADLEQLALDHDALREELATLARHGTRVSTHAQEFLAHLRAHEAREEALLRRALAEPKGAD